MERYSCVFLLLLGTAALAMANDLARGWGDNVNWYNDITKAQQAAATENKPIMVLIHKSWCGACKSLKPKFAASQDIMKTAEKFIMVQFEDDEEPQESKWSQDGAYIPRIFFLNSEGEIDKDIINEDGNPSYKYYYPEPSMILKSMNTALTKMGGSANKEKIEL